MPVEGLAGLGIIPGLDAQASAFRQRAAGLREESRRSNTGRGRGTSQGQQREFGSDELLALLQGGQASDFQTIGIDDPRAQGGRFLFRGNIETGEFDPFERAQISIPEGPLPQRGPLPEREQLGLPAPGGPTVESLPPSEFSQLLQARETAAGEEGRDFPSVPSSIIEGVIPDIPEDIADEVRRQLAALKSDRAARLPLLPEEDREFIEFGVRSGAIRNPAELFRALGNVRASARQRRARASAQGQDREEKESIKFETALSKSVEKVSKALANIAGGPGTNRDKVRRARTFIQRQEPRFVERLTSVFGDQLQQAAEAPLSAQELFGSPGRPATEQRTTNPQLARTNFFDITDQAGVNAVELVTGLEALMRQSVRLGEITNKEAVRTLTRAIEDLADPDTAPTTAVTGGAFGRATGIPLGPMEELLDQIEEFHERNADPSVPEAGMQARRLASLAALEFVLQSIKQRASTEGGEAIPIGQDPQFVPPETSLLEQIRLGFGRTGTREDPAFLAAIEALGAEGGSTVVRDLQQARERLQGEKRTRQRERAAIGR